MSVDKPEDEKRRRFLIAATTVVGSVGATFAAVPFVQYLQPSQKAAAEGAPVKIDISKLELGQQLSTQWQGKPVAVLRRVPEVLERLNNPGLVEQLSDPDSDRTTQQPDYTKNTFRSVNSEYLVFVNLCTHLGCIPTYRPEVAPADLGGNWFGGYYCPCHGSKFDLAGRVFKNVPAPTNLVIPPYRFLSEKLVLIGEDTVIA